MRQSWGACLGRCPAVGSLLNNIALEDLDMANNDGDTEHEGVGAAVKRLSEDLGILVRNEMELARREMTDKAKAAGLGAGMLSASAASGLLTLGSLTALLIIAIALALPAWLAALIVTVMWAAITAVLAL